MWQGEEVYRKPKLYTSASIITHVSRFLFVFLLEVTFSSPGFNPKKHYVNSIGYP